MKNLRTKRSVALHFSTLLLLVSSIVELHLYRIPRAGLLEGNNPLVRVAYTWGTLSHFLAMALAVLSLALIMSCAATSKSSRGNSDYWPLFLIPALLTVSLIFSVSGGDQFFIILQVASMFFVSYMALRFFYHVNRWAQKIMIALFATYQLLPRYALATNDALRESPLAPLFLTSKLLTIGEFIMVAATLSLLPAYFQQFQRISLRRKIRPLVVATAVAALLTKGYLEDPSATAYAFSQTSGLQLALPFPFYLVAIWMIVFIAVTLRTDHGQNRYAGYGLVFVFLSGFLPLGAYQNLLSGLGFALLAMKSALDH